MSDAQDSAKTVSAQRSAHIPVLAAVIERDSKFLICQRPPGKRFAGLWEFPGGKLEPHEGWFEAAVRELHEELGVTVVGVGHPLFEIQDQGSAFIIAFVPVEIGGNPTAIEHTGLQWVTIQDLSSFELAPSDSRFVEWLLSTAS